MKFPYKREIIILSVAFFMCLSIVGIIKLAFFSERNLIAPVEKVSEFYNPNRKSPYLEATTKAHEKEMIYKTNTSYSDDNDSTSNPVIEIPTIKDDGSLIYDGLTETELANKLNRSLKSTLANTGVFFAEYTKKTGLDPYLAVSIVLLETGCTWQCSTLVTSCNNIGGLKGHGSCGGSDYSSYPTLEEGINSYLDIIYNGYMLKGLTTPELMGPHYAESPDWARKVNAYIEQVKAK